MILELIIGIILARILSPKEFGLIGMIAIFIAISQIFVNSGFRQALIRKKECTELDYSTVFVFNLISGIILFWSLFISSPFISRFFGEPKLIWIVRVLSFSLIISSFTIIQRTTLVRRLDFKMESKIGLTSSFLSGLFAILAAYFGLGVWSLVIKTLSREAIYSVMIWFMNGWEASFKFSKKSFIELFGFGSNLLISGILGAIFKNIYSLIIGKYFSAETLGYFNRADMFKRVPSENISSILTTVTYPALAKVQDDKMKLKQGFVSILNVASYVVFILMFGLIATAEPLILTLLGEKWRHSIVLLQLLCFTGMFYPLNTININILNVLGRSDLYMKLQFVIQLLSIPAALLGVIYGINVLIYAMIFNVIVAFVLFSHFAGRMVNYTIINQIKSVFPFFIIALSMAVLVYYLGFLFTEPNIIQLICQILIGAIYIILLSEFFKIKSYLNIKNIILSKIKTN